ncbi:hypothetical protein CDAR_66921 [Caerostris darwini]|uniref:Uncharacterized protein n=1 Tax=Caerostris darwini TaxID=1538125 RepID=A0AAV4QYU6_9ARAC|nr:hypothetical protein CDAR_66921 [Caerostris darwini]
MINILSRQCETSTPNHFVDAISYYFQLQKGPVFRFGGPSAFLQSQSHWWLTMAPLDLCISQWGQLLQTGGTCIVAGRIKGPLNKLKQMW